MSKVIKSLAEVNSIEEAAAQGYKVTLDGDGCAEVLKANGDAYHVYGFECDCPDAWNRNGGSYQLPDGRRVCKHVALVLRLYPCPLCGSAMVQTGAYFECSSAGCGFALDMQLVREARQPCLPAGRRNRQEDAHRAEVIRRGEEAAAAIFA